MADYIERQAAINRFENLSYEDWNQGASTTWANAFSECADMIRELPSADIQPVPHGHWMLYEAQNRDDVDNGNYLYFCSNCNHGDVHAKTVEVPFCWFCGARMDGEQDDG